MNFGPICRQNFLMAERTPASLLNVLQNKTLLEGVFSNLSIMGEIVACLYYYLSCLEFIIFLLFNSQLYHFKFTSSHTECQRFDHEMWIEWSTLRCKNSGEKMRLLKPGRRNIRLQEMKTFWGEKNCKFKFWMLLELPSLLHHHLSQSTTKLTPHLMQ